MEGSGDDSATSIRPLPVMALRDKIVEKVCQNRVTLIVGDTGCGKSSQVPQFLLDEGMEPILCTQPRRFAVVALARTLAEARNSEIGEEVGYHIGHTKACHMISARSRLVFKTAGVLLEQVRDKGMAALNYKVIILDEVHERSVESDLVLACVKQLMMKNKDLKDLRLILMSATADITRYRDYFNDLGRGERVEVIAIPTAPQKAIFQRKVLYLDQVADLLGLSSESLADEYCSGASSSKDDAYMEPEVHTLIHKLVLHIHENEPDIEKSILIFLPTYYALEKQWILLRPLCMLFKVQVLHRSIDTDQALRSMRICKSHRKIILATNIAESSVTIPSVAFVIDSCRSLQVFWDSNRKKDLTELVWISKSQADQRKGRTGRTCDGQIFRLVTASFYNSFDGHEYPAILKLSLRQQVLRICCAQSKAINDPKVLLQKVMDPPDVEVVEEALEMLVSIRALQKLSNRARYEPTFYGSLLDSLSLSLDASVLALKFGKVGLLREGILISTLMDVQPLPIMRPFGEEVLFAKYLDDYFVSNIFNQPKKESLLMANFCAYQFWQRVFKDDQRLDRLQKVSNIDEPRTSESMSTKLEEEWCLRHNLVQTSLHNISELYEEILSSMHRFRPEFLAQSTLPSYFEPDGYKHKCLVQPDLERDSDATELDEDGLDSVSERGKCVSTPFVGSNDFQVIALAENLKRLVKEMRMQNSGDSIANENNIHSNPQVLGVAPCIFFTQGLCSRGESCRFSHCLEGQRPICKFYFTLQGCRNGDACVFAHDYGPRHVSDDVSAACLQENAFASMSSFLQLLPWTTHGYVLVLDDRDLYFSSNLSQVFDPAKIIAVTSLSYSEETNVLMNGARVHWGASKPYCTVLDSEGKFHSPWKNIRCVLVFFECETSDASKQLQFLLEALAVRMLADSLCDLSVVLTLKNSRFVQLQVERLARECFFSLTESFPFDESTLGKLHGSSCTRRPLQRCMPISYVFNMHPPSEIQFGNYKANFHRSLYGNR